MKTVNYLIFISQKKGKWKNGTQNDGAGNMESRGKRDDERMLLICKGGLLRVIGWKYEKK